jgi:hypothetical protein
MSLYVARNRNHRFSFPRHVGIEFHADASGFHTALIKFLRIIHKHTLTDSKPNGRYSNVTILFRTQTTQSTTVTLVTDPFSSS